MSHLKIENDNDEFTHLVVFFFSPSFLSLSLDTTTIHTFIFMCLYVHHFSIFHMHTFKHTYDWESLSFDKQTLSIFRCSFVVIFYAHNWRLAIVLIYKRREQILKYKEQFVLLVRSCYVTNGWSHSLFVVVMLLLLIMHSTHIHIHTSCNSTEVNIHNIKEDWMCKRAFIEVTGDDSGVVSFCSLDQTQFIVQHANERSYIEDSRREKKRSLTQSLFFY
jgi:hypothetical protein